MAVRKLVAIVFTDIAGYTALMQQSEATALAIRNRHRAIFEPLTAKYHGRIIQYYGDGTLSTFDSTVEAVKCAHEMQSQFRQAKIPVRIGIHTGDVMITDDDIIGDSVNLASRIESLGVAGAVLFSGKVMEEIKNQDDLGFGHLGSFHFKNDGQRREVYALRMPDVLFPERKDLQGKLHQPDKNKLIKLILFSILLFILLGGFWSYRQWFNNPAYQQLALLPFDYGSSGGEYQAIIDGVHDDLLSRLQQSGLEVTGRTSVLRYRGTDEGYPQIADELNVDGLLTGSVIRNDDTLGLSLRLIDGITGHQVWKATYLSDFRDIEKLYGEITREVFQGTGNRPPKEVLVRRNEPGVNPDAYKAYLRGQQYWYALTREDLETSLQYFELAKQIDPNFAPAYAGIAAVWGGRLQQGYVSFSEVASILLRNITEAEEMGGDLPEVQFWKAASLAWWWWDWDAAEQAFVKALKLNPNYGEAHAYYGLFLCIRHRYEEANRQIDRALELDPFNPLFHALDGMVLNFSRRYDKVIEVLTQTLERTPNDPVAISALRTSYHLTQQFPEAIEIWTRYFQARKDSLAISVINEAFRQKGYHDALNQLAELYVDRSENQFIPAYQIATLYTRAGQVDKALTWLEQAFREHDANMYSIATDPIFDLLQNEPRFQELLDKMDLNYTPLAL
ncbi:MAG: hypothetical protein KDC57_19285 [Saprospiraceae bacterium]|nr:hypothetical protein [Saprospiraceae bacterium]